MLFNANVANSNVAVKVAATTSVVPQSQSVEEYVREYFADEPVLAEIARCESHFRQYDSSGATLRGELVKEDVGIMQINEYFHSKQAEKLNLDLLTIEGNLAYGKYLFEKEGTKPWSASAPCWEKAAKVLAKN